MKVCPACGLVFPDETTFCFLTGDTLKPTGDAVIGTSLAGLFRIVDKLADGPWATCYRAQFRLLKRNCVVKIWKEPLTEDEQLPFREAVALARRCTHAHITELVGGGILPDGRAFAAHAAVDAPTLADQLARGRFAPSRALGIAAQLLEALARVHDFGGVHGSLRPSNVLLTSGGHAQLIEVGLGRSLRRDPWEEDPRSLQAQQYLAPELSSQQRSSAAADLYAVGVITVHMLTGQLPFPANNIGELRSKLNDQGVDIDGKLAALHEKLREWLKQLVDRNEESRHPNAHLALEALREAAAAATIKLEVATPPEPEPSGAELSSGFQRWERFRALFSKMIEIGFPAGAPDQTRSSLAAIAGRVEQLGELGRKALFEHQNLADVISRAREGRESIARQMDEVNASAKEVRKELHPLKVAAARHGEKALAFPAQALELHRELMQWEGRSALAEPYRELADAYRAMADIIETWWGVRNAQLTCETDAAEKNEELRAFEEQLEELRQALKIHESNLAAELVSSEESLRSLGSEADRLEMELLDLASRFSAPLRSKPELGACFRELAQMQ